MNGGGRIRRRGNEKSLNWITLKIIMTRKIIYPFIPKSTSYMVEGQFWDIPLSNGKFACGRVIQFDHSNGKKNSRLFLAGLLEWTGIELPTAESIAGARLLEQGGAHIRTIPFCKGMIRGYRSLDLDRIVPIPELSEMPTINCWLLSGFDRLRLATLEERKTLYIHSTWGLGVIAILAECYFVKKTTRIKRSPWNDLQNMKISN